MIVRAVFEFESVAPRTVLEPHVESEVADVSPTFKSVYQQALAAEAYGLDQIAGVGLRKALEVLVKDFCIHNDMGAAEEIKAENLAERSTSASLTLI